MADAEQGAERAEDATDGGIGGDEVEHFRFGQHIAQQVGGHGGGCGPGFGVGEHEAEPVEAARQDVFGFGFCGPAGSDGAGFARGDGAAGHAFHEAFGKSVDARPGEGDERAGEMRGGAVGCDALADQRHEPCETFGEGFRGVSHEAIGPQA